MSETILELESGLGGGQAQPTARHGAAGKEGIGAYSGVGAEPLARLSDIDEFRSGYAKLKSGEWDVGKWQGYRLRFGVYGQLQPNVHMIRIKIPGGVLSFDWLRRVAEANRRWGGKNIHISTRQDLQDYYVKPDDVPDYLQFLAEAGITTREACGNTLRNMTACALSGVCPREHVDAGAVAQRLAVSWIRHPLAQHMPRKFKATVSGCETDCGSSHIHDLGLIATHKDGKPGFKVYAGGGTGGIPISASLVADFVEEGDLPAVVEALVRLHQRYSNRRNRNKARLKFINKRFGPEKFRELFEDAFNETRTMPQRPWQPLDWRQGDAAAPEPATPGGVVDAHDGGQAVVVHQELGLFTADELDALTDLAEKAGAREFRTTRDQNLVIVGLHRSKVEDVVAGVRALGFLVEDGPGSVANVVACPGTSTCGIGITNSQSFGATIQDAVSAYQAKPNLSVKISGCQNGCGLHHVADFGFRGMGKKIAGRNAPHYQIYIGGHERENGHIGLAGPVVPARLAEEALDLLLAGYAGGGRSGETVRDWALRIGKEGMTALIKPVAAKVRGEDEGLFFDYGEDWVFTPPAGRVAECAAGINDDDLQKDLADDALINVDRALATGATAAAARFGAAAFRFAAQRLRIDAGMPGKENDTDGFIGATVRAFFSEDGDVLAALERIMAARARLDAADRGIPDAEAATMREALAYWIDMVDEAITRPPAADTFEMAALGDSGGVVAAMIKNAPSGVS